MSTGDMKNNLRKLRSELHQISYNDSPDYNRIMLGDPVCFLEILYFTIFSYNREIPSLLANKGHMVTGLKDEKFMNVVYKLMREMFNYNSALKVRQFLTKGFAERKIIATCEIIQAIRKRFPAKNRSRTRVATNISVVPTPTQSNSHESCVRRDLNHQPPQPTAIRHYNDISPVPPIAQLQNIIQEEESIPLEESESAASSLRENVESGIEFEQQQHVYAVNPELLTRLELMESSITALQQKSENTQASDNDVNATKIIDGLKYEIERMKLNVDGERIKYETQIQELKAQVDVLTNRVLVLENATPKSPVCGQSLSCQVRSLNLQDVGELETTDKEHNSPLHASAIDTPDQAMKSIRNREAKLFKSVEETRQLLGLTDTTNVFASMMNAAASQSEPQVITQKESLIEETGKENVAAADNPDVHN